MYQDSTSFLEEKLKRAEKNVNRFLKDFELRLEDCKIEKRDYLGNNSLASWKRPKKILVKNDDTPESIIAHELIHVLQGTFETFRGFKYLYKLLSEGLAEFVAKWAYPEHEVKYKLHYQMVVILYEIDASIVREIITLDYISLLPEDIDILLNSPKVHSYFKNLVAPRGDLLRKNIKSAIEAEITDTTFITFGEDLRAWKFLIDKRFDLKRRKINIILDEYFKNTKGSEV